MKTVVMHFEDEQHKQLIAKKGNLTWIEFVMKLVDGD